MNMKKVVLSGFLAFAMSLLSIAAIGQCKEWKWPEDGALKAKAEESISLYTDYQKNNEFQKAVKPLRWLLINLPELNTSIYINGTDIYDELATKEKNPARKQQLIDSLMILYDLRVQYCGEEASVSTRKALSAAKHNINTNGKETEILSLFDKTVELNGNSVSDFALVPYMQVVRVNKLKLKTLTDEQVLQRYDKINEIIDAKIKKAQSEGKPVDKYKG
jgi:hypothetical protein